MTGPGGRFDHERHRREMQRFDQMWPWMEALAVLAAVVVIVLVLAGALPVSVLFED